VKHNNVVQHEAPKVGGRPANPADGSTPIGERFDWMDRVMAKAIEEAAGLTSFEVDFASQTAARLGRYGARTLFTAKQMAVAQRMGRKLEIEP
jgi:hypothetical protein